MKIRAFHFDLKGMLPRAAFVLKLLPELARMGYNAILLEIEDKFPFAKRPELAHADTWSLDEWKAIREQAEKLRMEIVPLVQCAGHLDYVMRHNKYRHLREGIPPRDTTSQWCLADPSEPFAIWKDMFDEIRDFFPDTEYFHIGADEFDFKLPCDRCKCEERFDFFIAHVLNCARYAVSRGCRPVVWDDTFRRRDTPLLDELLSMSVPCVWQYITLDESLLERMCRLSPEVWGASKIQNDLLYRGMGPQKAVEKNVDDWSRMNEKYGLAGHIGTIWGRNHGLSPLAANLPQSFYMLAYLGETLENGMIKDRLAFQKRFVEKYFGLEDSSFIDELGVAPAAAAVHLEAALEKASMNREILEIYRELNEIDKLFRYYDECTGFNVALYPKYIANAATDALTSNFLDGVRITGEMAAALQDSLRENLGKYFTPVLVEEFIHSRFDGILFLNEIWGGIIRRARDGKNI